MGARLAPQHGKRDKSSCKDGSPLHAQLPRMHFEVDQDRMMVTMTLDREAPARARPKRHNLRLPRIDRDFEVVSVQMNNGAAVGRPSEFDSFALLHPNGLHIA